MPVTRFHEFHGRNIVLSDNNSVAYRSRSFADSITFSERPLLPGEVFTLEIEANETGWSGYMRLGLTQMNPSKRFNLPAYSVPQFEEAAPGRSWIFPLQNSMDDSNVPSHISQRRNSSGELNHQETSSDSESSSSSSDDAEYSPEEVELLERMRITNDNQHFHSPSHLSHDSYPFQTVRSRQRIPAAVLPTDVGSRIGVMYKVNGDSADMHFILNGKDVGVKKVGIPYKDAPLYAIVDVYGITKKLRVVSDFFSLQSACLQVIASMVSDKQESLSQLPLPKKLRNVLIHKVISNQRL